MILSMVIFYKTKDFILKNKKEIALSLFCSIIIMFFQSIFNYLSGVIINFLILISNEFSDYYYLTVATNSVDNNTEYRSMILCTFFICFIMILIRGIKNLNEINKKNINKEEAISKNNKSKYSFLHKIILIFTGFYIFIILLLNTNVDFLNIKFRNNLKILSLFVKESRIKELEYRWLIMENKNDFYLINNDIEKLYKEYNVKENQNFKFKK